MWKRAIWAISLTCILGVCAPLFPTHFAGVLAPQDALALTPARRKRAAAYYKQANNLMRLARRAQKSARLLYRKSDKLRKMQKFSRARRMSAQALRFARRARVYRAKAKKLRAKAYYLRTGRRLYIRSRRARLRRATRSYYRRSTRSRYRRSTRSYYRRSTRSRYRRSTRSYYRRSTRSRYRRSTRSYYRRSTRSYYRRSTRSRYRRSTPARLFREPGMTLRVVYTRGARAAVTVRVFKASYIGLVRKTGTSRSWLRYEWNKVRKSIIRRGKRRYRSFRNLRPGVYAVVAITHWMGGQKNTIVRRRIYVGGGRRYEYSFTRIHRRGF